MAIAEPEPKKSEVAVTSTESSLSAKALVSLKSIPEAQEHASSSTQKNSQKYYLNCSIDFYFQMPDGWTDLDIGIFLDSCKENLERLQDVSIEENIKWQAIADAGVKKSKNPTLFTINSCLELAESIREYVSTHKDKMHNDALKKFCEDVGPFLPYFPPKTSSGGPGSSSTIKVDDVNYEDIFTDSCLEKKFSDSVYQHLSDIKNGKLNAWNDLSKTVGDSTGFYFDVKGYFEELKVKVMSDLDKEDDPRVKKEIFDQTKQYLSDIFDFVAPLSSKKSDIVSVVDSTVNLEEVNPSQTDDANEISSKIGDHDLSKNLTQPSDDVIIKVEPVTVTNAGEKTIQSSIPVKRGRGRPRKVPLTVNNNDKIIKPEVMKSLSSSVEPTSTTLLDETANSNVSSSSSLSHDDPKLSDKERLETSLSRLEPTSEANVSASDESRPRRTRLKRKRAIRILPPREAKRKDSSQLDSQSVEDAVKTPASRKSLKRPFEGFSGTDEEDKEFNMKLRVLRELSSNRETFIQQTIQKLRKEEDVTTYLQSYWKSNSMDLAGNNEADNDTLTSLVQPDETGHRFIFIDESDPRGCSSSWNYIDETDFRRRSSSWNLVDVSKSVLRRLPWNSVNETDPTPGTSSWNCVHEDMSYFRRGRGNLVKKNKITTFMKADSTMNPVVRLDVLNDSDLQELSGNIVYNRYLSNIDKKGLTLTGPPNIPVESAVLGKDVIATVYNPNTDTAKTHAGPGSPATNQRRGRRGRRRGRPRLAHSQRETREPTSYQRYYHGSDNHGNLRDNNLNEVGEYSPTASFHSDELGLAPCVENGYFREEGFSPSGSEMSRNYLALPSTSNSEWNTVAELASSVRGLTQNVLKHYQRPAWMQDFLVQYHNSQAIKLKNMAKMSRKLSDLEKTKINVFQEIASLLRNRS